LRKINPLFLVALAAAVAALSSPAIAQSAPNDPVAAALTPFAVNIDRAVKQSWPGFGIYLGEGLVITAAHVVGSPLAGDPSVHIAGQVLKAKFVKAGNFERVDLTVLRIDPRSLPPSLGLRRMPLCDAPPRPGQRVVTVTPQAVATSRIFPPQLLPPDVRGRFDTVIADVATTGNSGSGVFDPARQCLMGIMSRKIMTSVGRTSGPQKTSAPVDLAKYFVPATEIREFIKGL
jgi:S1-C subfamily serine protease